MMSLQANGTFGLMVCKGQTLQDSKIGSCAVLWEHQLHPNLHQHGLEGHWVINETILVWSHSTVLNYISLLSQPCIIVLCWQL